MSDPAGSMVVAILIGRDVSLEKSGSLSKLPEYSASCNPGSALRILRSGQGFTLRKVMLETDETRLPLWKVADRNSPVPCMVSPDRYTVDFSSGSVPSSVYRTCRPLTGSMDTGMDVTKRLLSATILGAR